MWAIRRASIRIKFRFFSSATFGASYARYETSSSSYTYNTGFSDLLPHISHRSVTTLSRFYSQNELGFSDIEEEAAENSYQSRRSSLRLFNAIIDSKFMQVEEAIDEWVEEGNDLSRKEISLAMSQLRKQRKYQKALQLSEWLEAQENIEFGERDYASRVNLLAKLWGLQVAENYIEEMIPKSFRRESVYQALLGNYVLNNNITKAEQVFDKIKNLKLPITTSACEQMLMLYKRTDRRKMAGVFLLMKKENIKPSTFTYRLLIDIRGKSSELAGMEQILEDMKGEGLEPDFKFQVELAMHYAKLGVIEKGKAVLKDIEGDNLYEKRWLCSHLLLIYASLGSTDDVKRVWEVCKINPRIHECLNTINAFGKLKKVREAEEVFHKMLKIWGKLSAKQYTAMLKVYAHNKMFYKGEYIVKRLIDGYRGIGPESLDALVKFYIEAGDIEEAFLCVNADSPRFKGKPLFGTYMMMLDEYAKRGDVDYAEMIFMWMRHDGYVLCLRQYNSLLQAYIIAKKTAYGFRKRLEADGIIPTKFMEARLARVDV